jgi:CYTH domain-containing protein
MVYQVIKTPQHMQQTQVELERKFLIKSLPDNLFTYKKHEMAQAYISIDDITKSSTRIRKKDDKYIKTTKIPNPQGKGNLETEAFVTREEYNEAIAHHIGFVVEKTRYLIPYQKFTIELDIFHGELDGLIMAEVEFENEKEADAFDIPDWFSQDVSHDKRFANKNLCRNGKPE